MTAVPLEPALERGPREAPGRRADPFAATLYFWLVVCAAGALVVTLVPRLDTHTHGWTTFALLGVAVATAQMFVVETPANQAYHTTVVFLVAAALLLPPELVALLAFVQHVPEWLKRRLPFRIQTFNIASWTLAALAVWLTSHLLERPQLLGTHTAAYGGAVACLAFVGVNHGLLAPMLRFARGHSLRETGLFSYENLSTDLVLAALGVALATLWRHDAWVVPFAVAPLVLIHRSLAVPTLEAEARIDGKTGLYNARHFAAAVREELERAIRIERPMSVVMADLDLLRDINNTYGHLAGDAVLAGVAKVFRQHLREHDVAARFGGEEFSILLPGTDVAEAHVIADLIRRTIAATDFAVPTSSEPVRATLSMGVAGYPRDGSDANALVHEADLAVYRAKVQGRNRVVSASQESLLVHPGGQGPSLVALPAETEKPVRMLPQAVDARPAVERRARPRPVFRVSDLLPSGRRLTAFVSLVAAAGIAVGTTAVTFAGGLDVVGLLAVLGLVAVGQALSIEIEQMGSISVSAVGALAGAAIVGPRAALPLAITISVVEWSSRRSRLYQVLFNIGALTLASLAAAEVFTVQVGAGTASRAAAGGLGLLAGLAYFAVNTGLLATAVSFEARENVWRAWRERFAWLAAHYLAYGFVAGMILEAYRAIGIWAIAVFAVPLFVLRETQGSYVRKTERASSQLRQAADTIQSQNVSLEQANRMLRERSTAAMESLSATVDARDAYTAGHSRRVQEVALAIGRALGLSAVELEIVGLAALFHDIGKLAVPESVLLKPARLSDDEWALMRRHAEEGASIINRLGFLADAVPSIRHHHERFDGAGYPDGLAGDEIPLGARIIHVADALDSMISTRVYRPARALEAALRELREHAGTQFCPRCVAALEQHFAMQGPSTAAVRELGVA